MSVLSNALATAKEKGQTILQNGVAKLSSQDFVRAGLDRINELEITRKYEVVRNYIKGNDFEADLDELIGSLQLESVGKPVSFTEYTSRNKRVAAKLAYIRNQAGMVIAFCGAAGGKLGAKIGRGNPAVIADAAVAGGAVGVFIVGFFAGKVVLKRYQSSGAIDVRSEVIALN